MSAGISVTAVWTEKMLGFSCRLMAKIYTFLEFSESIKQMHAHTWKYVQHRRLHPSWLPPPK